MWAELLERQERQIVDLSVMVWHVNFEPEAVLRKLQQILREKADRSMRKRSMYFD